MVNNEELDTAGILKLEKETKILESYANSNRVVNEYEDSDIYNESSQKISSRGKIKKRKFKEDQNGEFLSDLENNIVIKHGILFLSEFSEFAKLIVNVSSEIAEDNCKFLKIKDKLFKVQNQQSMVILNQSLEIIDNIEFNLSDKDCLNIINSQKILTFNGIWWVMQPSYVNIEDTLYIKPEFLEKEL